MQCQELKKLLQEKKELRRGDGSPLALEAVKEASKAAEEERNGKKSEEPKEQVEVKADGSVH